jgi:hypothetical protein
LIVSARCDASSEHVELPEHAALCSFIAEVTLPKKLNDGTSVKSDNDARHATVKVLPRCSMKSPNVLTA